MQNSNKLPLSLKRLTYVAFDAKCANH